MSRAIEALAPLRPLFESLREIAGPLAESLLLVGGAVRDAALGRTAHDLDFVAPAHEVEGLARRVAKRLRGALVPLDPETPTVRIVLTEGRGQIDLNGLVGGTLSTDLARRDFTVNALAARLLDILQGHWAPIDHHGGLADLERLVVRRVGPRSFADDPLRLLRCFRFWAGAGWSLDPDTAAALTVEVPGLARISRERIREELLALLAAPELAKTLPLFFESGVGAAALSFAPEQVSDSPALTAWALARQDGSVADLEVWLRSLDEPVAALVGLTLLVGGNGLWLTQTAPGERAADLLERLRLSQREARLVAELLPIAPGELPPDPHDPEAACRWWWRCGDRAPLRALTVGLLAGESPKTLAQLEIWLGQRDAAPASTVGAPPPLDGKQLMSALKLQPGPGLGQLLRRLHWEAFRRGGLTPEAALSVAGELAAAPAQDEIPAPGGRWWRG